MVQNDGSLALPVDGSVLQEAMRFSTNKTLLGPHVGLALMKCGLYKLQPGQDANILTDGQVGAN